MTRLTILAPALLGLACLVAPPCVAPASAQQTIKLATLIPEGSAWDKVLRDLGQQWTKDTQGRVRLVIYPGGVVGDEPDMVRKMRIGQLHAAALTTSGLSDIDPAFQAFSVPMFYDSYGELLAVLDKMEPLLKQRLEAKGFVLLNWGHGGWVHFFTKQPVRSVDDLRKVKMFAWAGDDAMVQLWKTNGFQPVALAATDILTGLQTGMIDALPTTPLAALSLQWFRSTPYMAGIGLAPLVGGIVVTKVAWNKISEADRALLLKACERAEARLVAEIPRQDTTAVEEMKRRGLTVTVVAPASAAEFRARAEDFAVKMRGTIIPADALDLARRERDAYRAAQGKR